MKLNINNAILAFIYNHLYTLLCVYVCAHMCSKFISWKFI